jgi:hypothetical protein
MTALAQADTIKTLFFWRIGQFRNLKISGSAATQHRQATFPGGTFS